MASKLFTLKFPIATILLVIALVSCKEKNMGNIEGSGLKGTLTGKISIGPICPFETDPTLPGCMPTKATYNAYSVAVWAKDQKTKIGVLHPQLNGIYQVNLAAGDYVIALDSSNAGIGGSNLPAEISVQPGISLILNISIDTGIR